MPSFADTESERRFIKAANIALRITHAVGASTASGNLLSISAMSAGVNVLPSVPVVLAVWAMMSLYVAAEFSAVAVQRSQLVRLARSGSRNAAGLLAVVKDGVELDRYIAACQIGITLSSLVAGAYAQAEPARIDRLVLSAFTYKGTGSPEIARRKAVAEERYRNKPRRLRDAAMIRSIFTRDGLPSAYDQAVAEALAAEELKFGDQVPTGTYLDMAVNLPLVDPKKVLSPVLMVRGVHDGNSTNEDLLDFYVQLPNGDRQFVILPAAHSLGYSNNRHLLWYAVRNFLLAPAPVPAA